MVVRDARRLARRQSGGGESPTPCCITQIRASPYTPEPFQRFLADYGDLSHDQGRQSLGQPGMESFFSSLKTERTAAKTHRTCVQAKA